MANQMIALQARGPQLPDVGAMNARYANVMANMTAARQKQDEIARAAEFRRRAESGVDVLTPEGFNQIAGLDPEGAAALRKSALESRKADAEFTLAYLGTVNEELQRANTPEQARAIGQTLKQAYPTFADRIDQTLAEMPDDPAQFPSFRQRLNLSALKASERIEYEIAKVTTELATSETGTPLIVTRGGLNAPTIKQPRSLIRAPSRTGTVEVGEQTTVEPGMGGPESTAPMMPGAKSPRLSASMASSLLGLRSNADYQVALQAIKKADPAAAEELRRIMPVFDPALSDAIREAAMAEFEVIPQGGPQGLVTGERGGVGGPDEGYVDAPAPFRLKNPSVAPYPGSAQVPLQRLGAEKRVEAQATKAAELEAETIKSKSDQRRAAQNFLKVTGVDMRTGKDPVAALIKRSTSGAVEALGAEFKGALPEQIGGGATPGSQAIGELETIAATITNNLLGGKLGTGISNEDRKMIERMVGDIANPYIPAGKRLAAWNRVKQIQMSYLGGPSAAPAGQRRTPVNKTAGGKNRPPLSSFEGR